jgi:serine/threonine-protein kinase
MDALSHAHAEGVIHRDVKPANIMLSRDGRVKLGDFGIAKVLEETHLTHTGEFLGTPAYIAPEQARGETVTAAVDQYALGVVLYELLAGRPPYTGPTPLAVLSQILIGKFPDIRELNEAVDERLAAAVHRTLNADPAARFADVAALMTALDALIPPISGTRERQLVAGLVADPASTVASVAQAVAEECLTTARRALAQGDVSQARTSARQALTRAPDNAEAKEMLDTLRQSVGQIVALPSASPAHAVETLAAPRTGPPSRFKLGLGAAGVALLTAAGLSTLFREPPPRVESAAVVAATAAVEPAQNAPLATEPPRAAASVPVAVVAPESAAPAEPERRPARTNDAAPREKPLPARPAAAAEAPPTAAPASTAPRVGHLRLVTQPWADVEIDGQHAGRTPYMPDAELSPGPHRLVLRNPGLPEHTEIIRIEAGQTLQRRVNLMPAGTSP